jgi:hypothetical protein
MQRPPGDSWLTRRRFAWLMVALVVVAISLGAVLGGSGSDKHAAAGVRASHTSAPASTTIPAPSTSTSPTTTRHHHRHRHRHRHLTAAQRRRRAHHR